MSSTLQLLGVAWSVRWSPPARSYSEDGTVFTLRLATTFDRRRAHQLNMHRGDDDIALKISAKNSEIMQWTRETLVHCAFLLLIVLMLYCDHTPNRQFTSE